MGNVQINLRPVTEIDLPNFVVWLNDPEITQYLSLEPGKITLEGEGEWLARVSAPDSRDHFWAIAADGRMIGGCSLALDATRQNACFGIHIGDKNCWGKGHGTAAVREILRAGFEKLDLHRIHLVVHADNPRAIRCYEKCGFRHEGLQRQSRLKGGRWLDLITMAILREEWQAQTRRNPAGDWSI
jgi:RimJ/RimL family protein N-acetyltransferase